MDFAIRNLAVLSYAQGFTHWHYRAAGVPLSRTMAPDFFVSVSDMMAPGDIIFVSASDGGAALFVAKRAETVATVPMMATAPTDLRAAA